MFVALNRDLYGQNCPFIGASLSIKNTNLSNQPRIFDLAELRKGAVEAFCQTRWRYPTVAARVDEDSKAVYSIDGDHEVKTWAERSVKTIVTDGGWLALREKLSRDAPMPSSTGDYCVVYLIVNAQDTAASNLRGFDILMHMHHVFTDGSGIRSILNEFISRLANPLPSNEVHWGEEVRRLLPASKLLVHPGQLILDTTGKDTRSDASTDFFLKPQADIGLPLYRPEVGPPAPSNKGTKLASHTFEPEFLPALLTVGRLHGVKLAAMLHSALLQAVYKITDTVPGPEDIFGSRSAIDLRNGWMPPPYNEKRQYVNSAIVIQRIEVPCLLFSQENGFWEASKYIAKLWEAVRERKGMVATIESEAAAFLGAIKQQSSAPLPTKPQTCPYFVSDPPGSQILESIYPISGSENLQFHLESYQLATDQSQAIVSARSHSFHDKLTLCLVFNAARNPKDKMQELLETWVNILKEACGAIPA
ncbi:hypothetical protein IFR04_008869 [Cadophora malorum]|uniref:Uncharacterized protein n=1 Tax=Cadophora malorum TaxID=108018 RepID=A0A8H7TAI2_9HELO|nr:hypothetical protein IFR04_008869 [Cadophora malorum]